MVRDPLSPPFWPWLCTTCCLTMMFFFGHARDICSSLIRKNGQSPKGYARLFEGQQDFYKRRGYARVQDTCNRPIAGPPGPWIDVMERVPTDNNIVTRRLLPTGKLRRCLNFGSYNYLGFADTDSFCTPRVLDSLDALGWAASSPRTEAGTTPAHLALEELVAEFVGKETAITFGMGFATNSLVIPALMGEGCLLISDALNHASIVTGFKGSGAKVKVMAHNDVADLERLLRDSISEGQPGTGLPWKKILILVEGVYSMEGEMCPLADIVRLKNKYKAYLWLDEAHSIGAVGKSGRGVVEWAGVDSADVDIMMGTFTKSFSSYGGYVAGSRELVAHLKAHSPAHLYATSMSSAAAVQATAALQVIMGRDGTNAGAQKLKALQTNTNYVRARLSKMGFCTHGSYDSPVVPVIAYVPAKLAAISRQALSLGLALVAAGFPAVPMMTGRIRLCVSAAHTLDDLDWALEVLDELGDRCLLKYQQPYSYQPVNTEWKSWKGTANVICKAARMLRVLSGGILG